MSIERGCSLSAAIPWVYEPPDQDIVTLRHFPNAEAKDSCDRVGIGGGTDPAVLEPRAIIGQSGGKRIAEHVIVNLSDESSECF
jgi:hypothetical protein